jgi:hypothetical protein
MANDTNNRPVNPNTESDLKRREEQQELKKLKKTKQVEERPADRVRGQEEGKKSGSPTPLPDEKAVDAGARRVPGDLPDGSNDREGN